MENKIFIKIVELQHKFNKQVADDYLDKNYNWNNAIIAESGELLESLGYKWWKRQKSDMENVKVEAIDLLHFVISDTLQRYYPLRDFIERISEEFEDYFTDDVKENECFENPTISKLINELNYNSQDRFLIMKNIFEQLNMSNEDVYIAYIVKNCLNKFRQDNGYKDGTYVKDWKGQEDNVIAYEIANEWGADEELFEQLYLDLATYYKEEVLWRKPLRVEV